MPEDTQDDGELAPANGHPAKDSVPVAYQDRFKPKWNWELIREYFVMGIPDESANGKGKNPRIFINLEATAKWWGMPSATLRMKASKEHWYDQRRDYQHQLAAAKQAHRVGQLRRESVDFDADALKMAREGLSLVHARLDEVLVDHEDHKVIHDVQREQGKNGEQVVPAKVRTMINARELESLAKAATKWHSLGQSALGTDIQRHEIAGSRHQSVEINSGVSAAEDLRGDDPDGLVNFLTVIKRTPSLFALLSERPESAGKIVDVEPAEEGMDQRHER